MIYIEQRMKLQQHSQNFVFKMSRTRDITRSYVCLGYGEYPPSNTHALLKEIADEQGHICVRSDSFMDSQYYLAILHWAFAKVDTRIPQCQIILLLPTRQKAYGLYSLFKKISNFAEIKAMLIVGGVNIKETSRILKSGRPVHLVLGTPGRVKEMLFRNFLKTGSTKNLMLLDFEETISRGFHESLKQLLLYLEQTCRLAIFYEGSRDIVIEFLKEQLDFREPVKEIEYLKAKRQEKIVSSSPPQIFFGLIPSKLESEERLLPNLVKIVAKFLKNFSPSRYSIFQNKIAPLILLPQQYSGQLLRQFEKQGVNDFDLALNNQKSEAREKKILVGSDINLIQQQRPFVICLYLKPFSQQMITTVACCSSRLRLVLMPESRHPQIELNKVRLKEIPIDLE